MNEKILRNLLRFISLVLIQVLILNKIQLSGYINPYLYVFFILLLPFETPKWLLLVVAFMMGITIDLFSSTSGLHTTATLLMAFARPTITNLISTKHDLEQPGVTPSIKDFGLVWFLTYSGLLVFIHHFTLFFVEILRWSEFFQTFVRVLASSIVTIVLVILSEYLFYKRR